MKVTAGMTVQLIDMGWAYLPIFELLENENHTFSIYTNSGLRAVNWLNNLVFRFHFGKDR